jgi:tetratricopeptide (TPR) repeat protein
MTARALGDQWVVGYALHGLASLARRQGQLEESRELAQEAKEVRERVGNHFGAANDLAFLGSILIYEGKPGAASAMIKEGIKQLRNLGARLGPAWWHIALGFAKAHLGQYQEALADGQTAFSFFQDIDMARGGVYCLYLLGCIELAQQRWTAAREWLQQCTEKCRLYGDRDYLAAVLAWLGYAVLQSGDSHRARRLLNEALREASPTENPLQLVEMLPAAALILAAKEEEERAVELYGLASRYPYVANSRWFEDVAGKPMAAAAAALPSDVVAEAQQRGQALELQATVAALLEDLMADAEIGGTQQN